MQKVILPEEPNMCSLEVTIFPSMVRGIESFIV